MGSILEEIENLPNTYGCYFFKNKEQEIIYIGKSKNIKKRVKTYFGVVKNPKIKKLAREARFVETQITDSESDALLLECFLIKKYSPKYNTMLKKDKLFPYIKIDYSLEYPSISITYEQANNCYGFFYSEEDAIRTINLIGDVWKAPVCGQPIFKNKRECLRYHIGKCSAPCVKKTDKEGYNKSIKEIVLFFKQKHKGVFNNLNRQLKSYIKNLEFEKAEIVNHNIESLKFLCKKIKRVNTSYKQKNLYLLYRAFNEKELSIFYVKNGKLLSRHRININEINYNSIEKYITDNESLSIPLYPEFINIKHLLEIVADKYFVEDRKKYNLNQKSEYLLSKIYEFLS
ncbi:MAG: GIY-YIG nuclease family protein [Clostridiales bacterium]|nr:GIY-YIG nuclease family protein [Clostridiales bacterium]